MLFWREIHLRQQMESYNLHENRKQYIYIYLPRWNMALLYFYRAGKCQLDQTMKKCLKTLDNNVLILHRSLYSKDTWVLNQGPSRDYHNQIKQNPVKASTPSSSLLRTMFHTNYSNYWTSNSTNEKSRNSEVCSKIPHKWRVLTSTIHALDGLHISKVEQARQHDI